MDKKQADDLRHAVTTADTWTASERERRAFVGKGLTVVATMRKREGEGIDANLIAWAEAEGLLVKIDRKTEWGNPFKETKDCNRAEACKRFEEYLQGRPDLLARLGDLKGKVLLCWCHPLRCHGDFLAARANELDT
jgi:hypothetical protein